MVSLIQMFVLCLFDKYFFETYESVTEYFWNLVFQIRPLTQLLSLRLDQQVGRLLGHIYEGRLISNAHSEIFCRRSKVAVRAQCVLVATTLLHSGA